VLVLWPPARGVRQTDRRAGGVHLRPLLVQATRLAAGSAVEGQAEGSLRLEPPESQAKCSFCGLEARKARHLVVSGLAVPAGKFGEPPRICDRCRDLGLEILGEPSPA
jgi:hypothetical protein